MTSLLNLRRTFPGCGLDLCSCQDVSVPATVSDLFDALKELGAVEIEPIRGGRYLTHVQWVLEVGLIPYGNRPPGRYLVIPIGDRK